MPAKKKRRYASQKQVKWAYANKKEFASRWAHRGIRDSGRKTWYRKLPKRAASGRRKKK